MACAVVQQPPRAPLFRGNPPQLSRFGNPGSREI